jgi:hypothetical protein
MSPNPTERLQFSARAPIARRGDHCANSEILRIRRERGGLALSDAEIELLSQTLEKIGPLVLEHVLACSLASRSCGSDDRSACRDPARRGVPLTRLRLGRATDTMLTQELTLSDRQRDQDGAC